LSPLLLAFDLGLNPTPGLCAECLQTQVLASTCVCADVSEEANTPLAAAAAAAAAEAMDA